jgi:glucose-6-phosphate 1-dehydrogenase
MSETTSTTSAPFKENPLRQGLTAVRTAPPCVMVIFGASGDLTQRMLIPSLFDLAEERLVPLEFTVLGMSRRAMTHQEFRDKVKPADPNPINWETFSSGVFYMSGNHGEADTYVKLKETLDELDSQRGTAGNRLFYLAVSPNDFPAILRHLEDHGMLEERLTQNGGVESQTFVRVILEKPFGTSLATAQQLNKVIHQILPEEQIYRIDHYLGKETVQNILSFRFANCIFEPLWNRRYVDHVQITAAESLGLGDRAGYYDTSGALKDMVQNHLLQLLALVAMEPPVSSQDDSIRDEKSKVFKALRHFDPEQAAANSVRGQYRAGFIDGKPAAGYLEEKNVPPTSLTDTYAAVRFFVDNWRWQGVPFYLRTGKRMAKKVTEIAIIFKHVPHALFGTKPEDLEPNVLVLKIGPDEGISLRFGTKTPGMTRRLRWVNMDFDYGSSFSRPSPPAYARLLHDAMIGDPTLYSRGDAIEAAWQATQPIIDAWASQDSVPTYECGTWGPDEAEKLIEDDGRFWRKL